METEKRQTDEQISKLEKLGVPPGFESLTSFVLKRVERSDKTPMGIKPGTSLKHRPWILYDEEIGGLEESDSEQIGKVTAELHKEEACPTVLEGGPVFRPTEEEFEDTLKYIASIRTEVEPYGICRIIPPDSWHPPRSPMTDNHRKDLKFTAHVQRIQSLNSNRKIEEEREKTKFNKRRSNNHEPAPCRELEPSEEFTIKSFKIYADEFKEYIFRSEGKYSILGEKILEGEDYKHQDPIVERVVRAYGRFIKDPRGKIKDIYHADLESGVLGSGFQSGSNSTGWNLNNISKLPGSLLGFESNTTSNCLLPRFSLGMCFSFHGWKLEDHHLYSLHYMHSGDPKVWYCIPGRYNVEFETAMKKYFPDLGLETPYLLHEMVAQLTPSVLKLEGIPVYRCVQSGGEFVLIFPGAYHSGFNCGFNISEKACFAPIDWLPHGQNIVELYGQIGKKTSISYDKVLFGAATKALRAQFKIEVAKDRSEDNLRWAAFWEKDGILAKAFESRIKQETLRREVLSKSSQIQKMEMDFDSTVKRECSICFYDLHLSASSCPCSPDRYTCLKHTNQLCSCIWSSRIFLFRHTDRELKHLLEAVEGRMKFIIRALSTI